MKIQFCNKVYLSFRPVETGGSGGDKLKPPKNFAKFYFYELKKNSVKVKNSRKLQNKLKLLKGY